MVVQQAVAQDALHSAIPPAVVHVHLALENALVAHSVRDAPKHVVVVAADSAIAHVLADVLDVLEDAAVVAQAARAVQILAPVTVIKDAPHLVEVVQVVLVAVRRAWVNVLTHALAHARQRVLEHVSQWRQECIFIRTETLYYNKILRRTNL